MLRRVRIQTVHGYCKKIKPILLAAIVAFSTLYTSLLAAPVSYATSGWDGIIQPINSLHIQYGDDNRDISTTYVSLIHDHCTTAIYNRFVEVMNSGVWTVKEDRWPATPGEVARTAVTFWLSTNPAANMISYDFSGKLGFLQTGIDSDVTLSLNGQLGQAGVVCGGSPTTDIGAAYFDPSYIYASNWPITYPDNYDGMYVPSILDADNDGLTNARERTQGTSDVDEDTDNDGLSDLKESSWNPYRDDLFCKLSVTPHVCAYPNPTSKDLYVELDWMDDGVHSYKPTNAQIEKVKDAFANHDIVAHFDVGQYGGGNLLPSLSGNLIFLPTDNEIDFYDLKNGTPVEAGNFDSERQNTWYYMVAGANFMVDEEDTLTQRTGASFPGDDDSIVSMERITDLNPTDFDTAVAGTILHELGHNLCLSNQEMYTEQGALCLYGEIDKEMSASPSVDYNSVMNYRYQLTQADYSHGANGSPNDHDDWSAIALGLDDFTSSSFEGGLMSQNRSLSSNKSNYLMMREAVQD